MIEYVGMATVYDRPERTYIYPGLMISVRTGVDFLAGWLRRIANSPIGRKFMMDNATGTAGTMPKISGEILRRFPVPLPPCDEINEILRRVSVALTAARDTESVLDAEAARLKQSTPQIRLRVPRRGPGARRRPSRAEHRAGGAKRR